MNLEEKLLNIEERTERLEKDCIFWFDVLNRVENRVYEMWFERQRELENKKENEEKRNT